MVYGWAIPQGDSCTSTGFRKVFLEMFLEGFLGLLRTPCLNRAWLTAGEGPPPGGGIRISRVIIRV